MQASPEIHGFIGPSSCKLMLRKSLRPGRKEKANPAAVCLERLRHSNFPPDFSSILGWLRGAQGHSTRSISATPQLLTVTVLCLIQPQHLHPCCEMLVTDSHHLYSGPHTESFWVCSHLSARISSGWMWVLLGLSALTDEEQES